MRKIELLHDASQLSALTWRVWYCMSVRVMRDFYFFRRSFPPRFLQHIEEPAPLLCSLAQRSSKEAGTEQRLRRFINRGKMYNCPAGYALIATAMEAPGVSLEPWTNQSSVRPSMARAFTVTPQRWHEDACCQATGAGIWPALIFA